jgi:hypothetical protein
MISIMSDFIALSYIIIINNQVLNYTHFHDTVASPSIGFQDLAAFGGVSSFFEVISEAE